jgi:predicted 3-demethylubiquinone-9 3-methyltransferase (glyoxalase superfamily)
MPKITTFIAYQSQAEEAAKLYVSIFPNSKIRTVARYSEGTPMPAGTVMTVAFELDGQEFVALNGGDHFELTDAISLTVECETQEEVDRYWEKLTAGGGQPGPCGWLTDRFGLAWQVVPKQIGQWFGDPDPEKKKRLTAAIMGMGKLDIAALQKAFDGK